jgi:hypothetical protein
MLATMEPVKMVTVISFIAFMVFASLYSWKFYHSIRSNPPVEYKLPIFSLIVFFVALIVAIIFFVREPTENHAIQVVIGTCLNMAYWYICYKGLKRNPK